jgi:4-hydroxymandelate oxidase
MPKNNLTTLSQFEAKAKAELPKAVYDFFAGGAQDEITLKKNVSDFDQISLYPRVLREVQKLNTQINILGKNLSAPIIVAPMALQKLLHTAGESGMARASEAHGIGMALSCAASENLEVVASCFAKDSLALFQLYYFRDRGVTENLLLRSWKSGYSAICLTVDHPGLWQRKNSKISRPPLPAGINQVNLLPYISELELKSIPEEQSLMNYLNSKTPGPNVTWKDVEWIVKTSKIPVVLKGILNAEDILIAQNLGIKTIIISNHGGRQLDGAISSIRALKKLSPDLKNSLNLILDGGIRRGTDIFKALALGAKAVMTGRPMAWGLASEGENGVSQVIEILITEFKQTMALMGCKDISEIKPDLLEF